jgi:hypothetical protein
MGYHSGFSFSHGVATADNYSFLSRNPLYLKNIIHYFGKEVTRLMPGFNGSFHHFLNQPSAGIFKEVMD